MMLCCYVNSYREKLINARIIASVLFEVLKTVTITPSNQVISSFSFSLFQSMYRLSILRVFCFLRVSQFVIRNRRLRKEMQSTKKPSLTFFHLNKEESNMQSCSSLRFDISWMIHDYRFYCYCILSVTEDSITMWWTDCTLKLIQIKAAIAVIRNVRGLPSAQDFKKHGAFVDLFDFLQHCFGFQVS